MKRLSLWRLFLGALLVWSFFPSSLTGEENVNGTNTYPVDHRTFRRLSPLLGRVGQ